jgi:acyl-CoA synthetase (AMP-forming)/AMP-acid ligase II
VGECAVFGVPDDKWGEIPAAYIALKPGTTLDADTVIAHCTKHLAEFKRPRVVKFVTEFPKTPIGKIQKNVLKEPYWTARQKKI